MDVDEEEILAVFPFFESARAYIKERNISIEDMLYDPYYELGRARGIKRARASVENIEMDRTMPRGDKERINEIISYVVARLIASCTQDNFIIRRFAEAERVRFRTWINTYAHAMSPHDREEFAMRVGRELGLDVMPVDYGEIDEDARRTKRYKYSIPAYQFLRHTTNIKPVGKDTSSPFKWKLTLRLRKGRAYISYDELIRICEEIIREKINSELPLSVPEEVAEYFKDEIESLKRSAANIRRKYEVKDLGKVDADCFPPCIKQILGMIQAGENVGHAARFSITAFLNAIGMNTDEILSIFHTTPDFDESKAKYQIEHITGKKSSTVYTPPECKTMKSYGICYNPDALCDRDWMTHPLKYYRFKRKSKKSK